MAGELKNGHWKLAWNVLEKETLWKDCFSSKVRINQNQLKSYIKQEEIQKKTVMQTGIF